MAQQQQQRRDDSDRKNDEFVTGTAVDPVAAYAYGTTANNAGFGAPGGGGMADPGTTGYVYQYTAEYATTGIPAPGYAAAAAGYGTTGAGGGGGQMGGEANADRGGGDTGMNRNMGRDQK